MHACFKNKKLILFDLDGTLYLGAKIIPGAVPLVRKLRAAGKKIFFYTNNSSRSENDYLRKLNKMGFCAKRGEIIMSTHSLIRYLKKKRWKRIFLLGTPSMKRMLSAAKIRSVVSRPQVVVIGFDKTLTYAKLEKASKLVERGTPYILTHPDIFCPTDNGREPDCGSIGSVIELVTNRKPAAVLGKPHPLMVKEVAERTYCRRDQMLLVGDRLSTDIQMGKNFGIQTVLVLSGETKRKDLKKSKLKPNLVISSVANLVN